MSCKFLGANGGSTWDGIRCIDWCRSKGAHIISASFGGGSPSTTMADAIRNSGALFVAAAGNAGVNTMSYPAAYTAAPYNVPNVISVAATK
jgi:subtilisin family serine protease